MVHYIQSEHRGSAGYGLHPSHLHILVENSVLWPNLVAGEAEIMFFLCVQRSGLWWAVNRICGAIILQIFFFTSFLCWIPCFLISIALALSWFSLLFWWVEHVLQYLPKVECVEGKNFEMFYIWESFYSVLHLVDSFSGCRILVGSH